MDVDTGMQASLYAVGLGSSVWPTVERIEGGIRALATLEQTDVVGVSSVITTQARGGRTLHPFANAVALVRTTLLPRSLLGRLHALERRAGRIRSVPLGSRTLDLDLLCQLDGPRQNIHTRVELPHGQLTTRPFVAGLVDEARRALTASS